MCGRAFTVYRELVGTGGAICAARASHDGDRYRRKMTGAAVTPCCFTAAAHDSSRGYTSVPSPD
jgi:hypothetical protein